MSNLPQAPAPEAGPDLAAALRSRGYRMTPQRRMVLEAVQVLEHATPEQILAEVQARNPDVNASTIYRTLDLLEHLGLVTHAHLGHGAPAYHSGLAPAHAHLLCSACGEVTELPADQVAPLVDGLRERYGFETNVRHLTVNGYCARCQSDSAQPGTPTQPSVPTDPGTPPQPGTPAQPGTPT